MTRVLLVDDSVVIQKILSKVLKDLGYDVVGTAKDGYEGVSMFQSCSPDVVLLDITMPNKDGRETLEEIKQIDSLANVIMISAVKSGDVVDQCLSLGAKAFLEKSSSMNSPEFKDSLKSLIDKTLEEKTKNVA